MGVDAFTTILVTGAGPVGLGAIVNARFRGARVIVVEPAPWRAARATAMGAAAVLDPHDKQILKQIQELTAGRGVDCSLDCAGSPQTERLCIDATRRKGKVAFIGECTDRLSLRVSPDMIRKGLTLLGSWHYNLNEFPHIMQIIQESPLIDLLVSHTFPMSRVPGRVRVLDFPGVGQDHPGPMGLTAAAHAIWCCSGCPCSTAKMLS